MTVKFEGQDRREAKLEKVMAEYGIKNLEEAREICLAKGIDVDAIVKGIQPIAFENASWAYTLGAAGTFNQWSIKGFSSCSMTIIPETG